MPPDPVLVRNTREWFLRAIDDLRVAEHDLKSESPFIRAALFHCQQATEKALKGFLTWHDQPFRKTHNLGELGLRCATVDPSLESLLKEAAALARYATRFRYPGGVDEPPFAEAQEALALARCVVDRILDRLPAEVRP